MSATAFQRMRREQAAKNSVGEKEEQPKTLGEPTNKELMAMLDELGVEYDKRANKATLKALLEEAQKNAVKDSDEDPMDLSKCSEDKLKALLDERGIEYDEEADRDILIELLEGAE